MSSLHNDLDTWASKSRAKGNDRIEILNETANEIAELLREHQQLRDAIGEIVKPLCAHRFKLSFNKVGNCTSLGNFAKELDGQWVWLIDATDGMNDPLFATNTTLDEQERSA